MQTDLDQIKQGIKITDLARQLGLQMKGSKQARCFNASGHKHGDKTPSLGFDLDTNRFKCFACGVSGSVIDLYMGARGVELKEAINDLKKMANIATPSQAQTRYKKAQFKPLDARQPSAGQKAPAGGIYEALRGFCGELDPQSLAYLTGATRGLTEETIARFKLFSIKDYPATDEFLHKQYSPEALQEAGIVSDDKGKLIFYKHTLIIPFMQDGEIIFLQGRSLEQATLNKYLKYLNLKRPVPLFNTDTLKDLKAGDRVYICEGVFDAMILEQHGYKAVAILGVNNFKPEMAGLFKGLDVVLCLDNDESGRQGTQALARIFLTQGQGVRTKQLPDGIKDITEYYLK